MGTLVRDLDFLQGDFARIAALTAQGQGSCSRDTFMAAYTPWLAFVREVRSFLETISPASMPLSSTTETLIRYQNRLKYFRDLLRRCGVLRSPEPEVAPPPGDIVGTIGEVGSALKWVAIPLLGILAYRVYRDWF